MELKMSLAKVRIRMDFNGQRINEPEVIEILNGDPDAHLTKLAMIYARMIKGDLERAEREAAAAGQQQTY